MNEKEGNFWFKFGMAIILFILTLLCFSVCRVSGAVPPLPPRPTIKLHSPKDAELKASLGVKMVTSAVLPPPYQSAAWWGLTIAGTPERHAFVYSDFTSAWVYLWPEYGKAFKLPGWTQLQCPSTTMIGDRLFLADMNSGAGGPIRISEFLITPTNAILVTNLFAGTIDDRCPAISSTVSGGVLVTAYRHDSSYNLDTAYRSPQGKWTTNFIVLVPPPVGISSIAIHPIIGPDNKTWWFINRDSSHVIDLARFDEGNLFDFHQALLNSATINGTNVQGEMAPNGEFPDVTLARSGTNVLLTYQNYRQEWPCEFLYSYNVVVSLGKDLVPHFVALNSNLVMEVFTPSPIFVNPNGFDLFSYELNPDCSQGPWTWRRFVNGQWLPGEPSGYTGQQPNNVAWSSDGWGFWRWDDNVPRLTKFPLTELGTRLKIERTENQVRLSWTNPKAGDVLQQSTDLTNWSPVLNQSNPMTLPVIGKRFFRVKTSP